MTSSSQDQFLAQLKRTNISWSSRPGGKHVSPAIRHHVTTVTACWLASTQFHNTLSRHHEKGTGASRILVPEHIGPIYLHADAILSEFQRLGLVNYLLQQAIRILFRLGLLLFQLFRRWLLGRLVLRRNHPFRRAKQQEDKGQGE